MITQKLYRNGNSVAVTIPKQYLDELHLSEESSVVVEKQGDNLVLSKAQNKLAPNVDAKFMKMVDEFINKHEDTLRELAKR